jgi:hypothetical protein
MIAGTLIGCENASRRFSDVWACTPEFCIANGMKCFDAILCQNQGRDGVIERTYKSREEESRVDR